MKSVLSIAVRDLLAFTALLIGAAIVLVGIAALALCAVEWVLRIGVYLTTPVS